MLCKKILGAVSILNVNVSKVRRCKTLAKSEHTESNIRKNNTFYLPAILCKELDKQKSRVIYCTGSWAEGCVKNIIR